MTDPELIGAELMAGFKAATKIIDENVPFMFRHRITDDLIMALVAAVVDAVDTVRDQQPTEKPQ